MIRCAHDSRSARFTGRGRGSRVYRIDEVLARHNPTILDAAALSAEVARFEAAIAAAAAELTAIADRVGTQVGEQEAAIFRAHRGLLRDPGLIGKVTNRILDEHVDAGTAALQATLAEYTSLFRTNRRRLHS